MTEKRGAGAQVEGLVLGRWIPLSSLPVGHSLHTNKANRLTVWKPLSQRGPGRWSKFFVSASPTSQNPVRFRNERGWRGFRPASWVVSLHFLVMPTARVAVCAGAQLQPDIQMTQGLEHLTPFLVYLRSLEDTSARTTPVRGQGLAWKGT